MKKIVCAIDHSAEALNALDYAIEVSRVFQSELFVINVVPVQSGGADADPAIEAELIQMSYQAAEKDFAELLKKLENKGVKCHHKQCFGLVGSEISSYAESVGSDCIILGNTQAGKLEERILGSTISSVINDSNIPVIIVPILVKFKEPKVITLATDFKSYSKESLHYLDQILTTFDSTLHSIHITKILQDFDNQGFELFKAMIENNLTNPRNVYFKNEFSDDLELSVHEFVLHTHSDMLVTIHRHRGFLASLFHKSKSLSISHQNEVAVLVLNQ